MNKYLKIAIILIAIILIIILLVFLNIRKNNNQEDDTNITIVTSFYPMYIIAENITEGAEGIELENMADVNVRLLT